MKNSYESGARKVIPSTLVYLTHASEVLMLHRIKKEGDVHLGKWNGLGGKLDCNESQLEGAQREVYEEAGVLLEPETFQPLGCILFPNFKPERSEDWHVSLFVAELSESQLALVKEDCPEGKLQWVPRDQVLDLPLWEGDKVFLPYILAKKAVMGCFWYEKKLLKKHWLVPL